MPTGKLKWFDAGKRYGFIEPDDGGPDIFLHLSKVQDASFPHFQPGMALQYSIGRNGSKIFADNVILVEGGGAQSYRRGVEEHHIDDEFEKEWGLRRL